MKRRREKTNDTNISISWTRDSSCASNHSRLLFCRSQEKKRASDSEREQEWKIKWKQNEKFVTVITYKQTRAVYNINMYRFSPHKLTTASISHLIVVLVVVVVCFFHFLVLIISFSAYRCAISFHVHGSFYIFSTAGSSNSIDVRLSVSVWVCIFVVI